MSDGEPSVAGGELQLGDVEGHGGGDPVYNYLYKGGVEVEAFGFQDEVKLLPYLDI